MMNTVFTILLFVFLYPSKYEQAMLKHIELPMTTPSAEKLQGVMNAFDRIAMAEKDRMLDEALRRIKPHQN